MGGPWAQGQEEGFTKDERNMVSPRKEEVKEGRGSERRQAGVREEAGSEGKGEGGRE